MAEHYQVLLQKLLPVMLEPKRIAVLTETMIVMRIHRQTDCLRLADPDMLTKFLTQAAPVMVGCMLLTSISILSFFSAFSQLIVPPPTNQRPKETGMRKHGDMGKELMGSVFQWVVEHVPDFSLGDDILELCISDTPPTALPSIITKVRFRAFFILLLFSTHVATIYNAFPLSFLPPAAREAVAGAWTPDDQAHPHQAGQACAGRRGQVSCHRRRHLRKRYLGECLRKERGERGGEGRGGGSKLREIWS